MMIILDNMVLKKLLKMHIGSAGTFVRIVAQIFEKNHRFVQKYLQTNLKTQIFAQFASNEQATNKILHTRDQVIMDQMCVNCTSKLFRLNMITSPRRTRLDH